MARKPRVDSTAETVRIMAGSQRKLEPPAHYPLTSRDMPFWESILKEFPRADWTDHNLEVAALLARMMADHEEQSAFLRDEGHVIEEENKFGIRTKENPRAGLIVKMAAQIIALRRSLSLHARSRPDNQALGKTKEIATRIERQAVAHEDLLPVPGETVN